MSEKRMGIEANRAAMNARQVLGVWIVFAVLVCAVGAVAWWVLRP